jgi:hypothetical protein
MLTALSANPLRHRHPLRELRPLTARRLHALLREAVFITCPASDLWLGGGSSLHKQLYADHHPLTGAESKRSCALLPIFRYLQTGVCGGPVSLVKTGSFRHKNPDAWLPATPAGGLAEPEPYGPSSWGIWNHSKTGVFVLGRATQPKSPERGSGK